MVVPEPAVAAGAQLFVLDRGGGPDVLGAVLPGAVRLRLGVPGTAQAINPWDVADPASVAESKIAFLVHLHVLLIGEHGRGADPLGLDRLERDLLERAVRDVYALAARDAGCPRESRLRSVLRERAR